MFQRFTPELVVCPNSTLEPVERVFWIQANCVCVLELLYLILYSGSWGCWI